MCPPPAPPPPRLRPHRPPRRRSSSLPFGRFRAQIAARTREVDRYPTGYFRTADGGAYLLILRVAGAGFGDRSGDALVARVNALVAAAHPTRFHPRMEVGLGGDVPNAIAERDSVVREAAVSFGLASLLILGGIMLFFRSPWSLGHIGLAMFTGVGLAYAVAWVAFGYLTLSTVSLGSIVAGNGINYAIVFLARYRERRGEGDTVEDALADASVTVRGGTWLSALAAAGAYGALMLSDFRCFSQFGLIGASGMLFCWCATMVVVPASITLVERLRGARSEGSVEGTPRPSWGRSETSPGGTPCSCWWPGRCCSRWPARASRTTSATPGSTTSRTSRAAATSAAARGSGAAWPTRSFARTPLPPR